ncbi:hypothetical protein [Lysobacter sp. F6437]|uniref:hypothetical protein n=1 Tax=Lysobacter sp. F6437 TaxID=3459296 RepID=UPI00403E14BD
MKLLLGLALAITAAPAFAQTAAPAQPLPQDTVQAPATTAAPQPAATTPAGVPAPEPFLGTGDADPQRSSLMIAAGVALGALVLTTAGDDNDDEPSSP